MENLNTATGGVEEGLTSRPRTTILVDEGGLVLVEVLEEPVKVFDFVYSTEYRTLDRWPPFHDSLSNTPSSSKSTHTRACVTECLDLAVGDKQRGNAKCAAASAPNEKRIDMHTVNNSDTTCNKASHS
ncbi:hypothetical protein M8J75_003540 [Diaphorina citri]|nr:hypothetical protein M8J75_003540 [Diaphorina citri]